MLNGTSGIQRKELQISSDLQRQAGSSGSLAEDNGEDNSEEVSNSLEK
jgi:hypothetical protein